MGGHVREAGSSLSISVAFLLIPWLGGSCVVACIAGPNEIRSLDDASLGREGPSKPLRDKISDAAVGTGMVESHETGV